MSLQQIGAQLILQGVNTFVAGATQAATAVNTFNNSLNKSGEGVKNFGTNLTSAGNFLQRTGFILSFQLTAPLVAASKQVFETSTDFEDAFAEVRKNVNDVGTDFNKLEKDIRDLALQIPVPAAQLADIAGQAGQVGIASKDIVSFTETMAKLTVATNLGADATQSIARIANLTGTKDFPRLGSVITKLGSDFAATEQEIVDMSLRLAGAGKVIGLSSDQILSIGAALSSMGIKAEMGGSAFSRVMIAMATELAKGGDRAKLFAEIAGESVDAFAARFQAKPIEAINRFNTGLGLIQEGGRAVSEQAFAKMNVSAEEFNNMLNTDSKAALDAYTAALGTTGDEGTNLFEVVKALGLEEIRVRDTLLRSAAAQGLLNEAIAVGSKEQKENQKLNQEAAIRYATTTNQLQALKNRVAETAIEIGKLITPDVLEAAKVLTKAIVDVAKAFIALDAETRRNILIGGAILAALAPVIVILGAVTSLAGLLTQGISKLIFAGSGLVKLLSTGLHPVMTTIATVFGKVVSAASGGLSILNKFFVALADLVIVGGKFIATYGVAGVAALIKLKAAAILASIGITSLGSALRVLIGPIGLVFLAWEGLTRLMEHTGTTWTDVGNTAVKVGAMIAAALVSAVGALVATIADMAAAVQRTIANIAKSIADFAGGLPLVGKAIQGVLDNLASKYHDLANSSTKAAATIRADSEALAASIIAAGAAISAESQAVEASIPVRDDWSTATREAAAAEDNLVESTDAAAAPVQKLGSGIGALVDKLNGDGDKKGGGGGNLKEAAEEAKKSLEELINEMSAPELLAFITQTHLGAMAFDEFAKAATNAIRTTGDISKVLADFTAMGKTNFEAFEFIIEALKTIHDEGPRSSEVIKQMALESKLLGDQWKFFEDDAKRMIKDGLITDVAAQMIQMGKTGKEAIEFITEVLNKLTEEEKEAAEKAKKLADDFILAAIAANELGAAQKAASIAGAHALRMETLEIHKAQDAMNDYLNMILEGIDPVLAGEMAITNAIKAQEEATKRLAKARTEANIAIREQERAMRRAREEAEIATRLAQEHANALNAVRSTDEEVKRIKEQAEREAFVTGAPVSQQRILELIAANLPERLGIDIAASGVIPSTVWGVEKQFMEAGITAFQDISREIGSAFNLTWAQIQAFMMSLAAQQERDPAGGNFQHGGMTNWAPSQKKLAWLHGQETVIPAHIRNQELNLMDKLLGMLGGMGNSYTINANYSESQSPVTISMDMQALMALTRY